MKDSRSHPVPWHPLRQLIQKPTLQTYNNPGKGMLRNFARAAAENSSHDASAKAVAGQVASSLASTGSDGAPAVSNATAAATSATSKWWQLTATDVSSKWNEAAVKAERLSAQLKVQAQVVAKKGIKIPGMKIDIDMINPVLTTAKETMRDSWEAMPRPIREVFPYLSCMAVVAVLVGHMYHDRLAVERQRFDALLERSKGLEAELAELKVRQNLLSHNAREVEMAEAVARATSAAAAAATAASTAAQVASTCALFQAQHMPLPLPQPGSTSSRPPAVAGRATAQQQAAAMLLAPGYGALQPAASYITLDAPLDVGPSAAAPRGRTAAQGQDPNSA